jgi:hypothetical protein
MATAQAVLTPTTDTTPAVVEIEAGELSGAQWVARFPGSANVEDCREPFKSRLTRFIAAMRAANATVTVSATFRPAERAYLMHWSWMIVKQGTDPASVPSRPGVAIQWVHPTLQASRLAARAMVNGYGINGLGTPPALNSRHTARVAVDMSITWSGTLNIESSTGAVVAISSTPRTGMNSELADVGAEYRVIKYNGSGVDWPHWSDTGS